MRTLILLFLLLPGIGWTQAPVNTENLYDTDLLTPAFYKKRREALRGLMADSSVAVVFASPLKNRSNDVDYEYHAHPDFYYLTGIREPDAVLLVFKRAIMFKGVKTNEVVFVKPLNPKASVWIGKILGEKDAVEKMQIAFALSNKEFAFTNFDWNSFRKIYPSKLFEDALNDEKDNGDTYSLQKTFINDTKEFKLKLDDGKFKEMLSVLRQDKQPEEIALIKKACDISCMGFKELMRALGPGMTEYQTEAIMEYFFKNNGAEFEGYPSICGAAENACVLHYSTNRRKLKEGDLMVVDAGAEYHGYTADITRTLPVSGKFTTEQKIIYQIVLEAQQAGIDSCLKGKNFWAAHSATTAIIKKRLLEYGIIKNESDYLKYFMHGTSHYLGLDVHDAGLYQRLMPGQVITVEPGIYIREGSDCDPKWWNIGVRIEDDILITENTPVILSAGAPKTVEEIEKLMQEKSFLNKE